MEATGSSSPSVGQVRVMFVQPNSHSSVWAIIVIVVFVIFVTVVNVITVVIVIVIGLVNLKLKVTTPELLDSCPQT